MESLELNFMEIPRYVVMGEGALEKLPKVVEKLSLEGELLIVSGSTITKEIAENNLIPILSNINFRHIEINSPLTIQTIESLTRQITENVGCLLAIGGGRIIEASKVASAWSKKPYIAVPTSPSNDGISSPIVSFSLRRQISDKRKANIFNAPLAIIAETTIIANAPQKSFSAGFGDLVSKFTSVEDWKLAKEVKAESYSEYAAEMALLSAQIALEHVDQIAKRNRAGTRVIMKALIGCGVSMSIAGSSRPASGAEHLFSHALDILAEKYSFKSAMHGEQCGLGTIMMAYLHKLDWMKIRDALKKVGAPTSAQEIGIKPKYIIEALELAPKLRPKRYTILHHYKLSKEQLEKIAIETQVI